ncbi:MAG: purine-nucleoside phosphorylase [Candidatus Omnitrophica bacterium]|nr:purine-nucleoside phosphorylase [Candidatus Omnitrophota bacterium]
MASLKERIKESANYIKSQIKGRPETGIILGTGLGALGAQIIDGGEISYDKIPNFPVSTVTSHQGILKWGNLSGKPVVAMEGRFHFYEGYSLEEVTFCVRVIKALGAASLVVSNACGGMNPLFDTGDIMIITDHINLMGVNPLIGPNDDDLGPRFPDMCEPYSNELIKLTEQIAVEEKIPVKKGVYVAVTGPCLETRAEYRFLRMIGADVVGMSTVPEVIVAVHCGLKVLGLSCVTDICLPDALKPADINEIIKVANEAEPKLAKLVAKVIDSIGK